MSVTVVGLLGTTKDFARGDRWSRWRPTVSLFQHEELLIDRLHLLSEARYERLRDRVTRDIQSVSPETEVLHHALKVDDPWDFQDMYAALHEFSRQLKLAEDEELLTHITTGTHVAQICLFLLTESRHLPGRLIQTSPGGDGPEGSYTVVDLDLSRYDRLASRFEEERTEHLNVLKSGIQTRNAAFNREMERMERVALASPEPVLITGPTGAGKTRLAARIYDLKRQRGLLKGRFVSLNCATLRGDQAMSALFGHRRGAFTGAQSDRAGLLKAANGGCLFLDEIGELGPDEQAMLLHALETGRFTPMGADSEVESAFQLIAGTNRDLHQRVRQGLFRDDLLARINLWHFRLPGLAERREDIAPNLDYELELFAERSGRRVRMNREARRAFLAFAESPDANWAGNFRDLNAAVIRMATLCEGGRIGEEDVALETRRLRRDWDGLTRGEPARASRDRLEELLGRDGVEGLDRFDRVQLADVVAVCDDSRSLSEAGRRLFSVSRTRKKRQNDADRLRKYLARFGLSWASIRPEAS